MKEPVPANEARTCATHENFILELNRDSTLEQRSIEVERQIQSMMDSRAASGLNVTIPVVVHLLYNTQAQNISDAQILSQIDVLNKDFARKNSDSVNTPNVFKSVAAGSGIRFCLAKRDPKGNPTNGIVRKYTYRTSFTANGVCKLSSQGGDDAWDCNRYLNIWVCNLSGYLGYATYPGGNPIADGVVIRTTAFGTIGNLIPQYNRGRTATHEVAHWLNVYHIWGDAQCGSDLVNDTPIQERSNYGCPAFPHVTCNNGPNGDMYMNYMDYVNDACMNMFTGGQFSRMEATLNSVRSSILTSNGCK